MMVFMVHISITLVSVVSKAGQVPILKVNATLRTRNKKSQTFQIARELCNHLDLLGSD